MYALVALVPFILLATVMSLSWWEDRILPAQADPTDASRAAPATPVGPHLTPDPTPLNGR
ncbi:hypothetical protein GCM10009837_20140 [Streptomyces durmitorensis]|uniref:Uncharacterized protein n=1 Tax=Streptomyces durmitorensis TaxID=319947 RepID=A0ABY4PQD6_9ACTN|nr:hypothetical protein [Streptomyces durmitorensis]UQT55330.1 hypothetical protein M4V62_09595 [Streptomyces durmitorensis]